MLDRILGREIAAYVRRHRGLLVTAVVLTAVSSLFVVIPAYLLQPFVDQGMQIGDEPVSWRIPWLARTPGSWLSWQKTDLLVVEQISPNHLLVILSLVAFLAVTAKAVMVFFGGLCSAAFANRIVRSLRGDLFRKFVSLPLAFHHKERSGELLARATADLSVMQTRLSHVVMGYIEHPLECLVFLLYLLFMNYRLTLLVFVAGPLTVGLMRLFGRKVKKHAYRVQEATAQVTNAYQEALVCLRVIHGFFQGEREIGRFEERADSLYRKVMRWSRWDLALSPIMDITGALMVPTILILGKVYFEHTLGELTSMIYAFSRAYLPVRKLAKVHNNLRTLQGATERVFDIMRTVPEIQDRPGAHPLPRHRESIEFRDASFGYSPQENVLKHISFRIRAGQVAAFVGSTGAGKSTLLDLVPRFFEVSGGSILIDGTDIREVTVKSLRSQIGIVSQDVLLFHDTIENNIRYGRPDCSREEVMAAARTADAHDFIVAQPKGYQTVVGDRGTLISGGQRQRIAIARAILVDPAILILDEAASALDAESESLVQKAIEELQGDRTILVVAHRLSTIMKADVIHVLEGGEIVETGTLEELLARPGRFRQLYELQFGAGRREGNPH